MYCYGHINLTAFSSYRFLGKCNEHTSATWTNVHSQISITVVISLPNNTDQFTSTCLINRSWELLHHDYSLCQQNYYSLCKNTVSWECRSLKERLLWVGETRTTVSVQTDPGLVSIKGHLAQLSILTRRDLNSVLGKLPPSIWPSVMFAPWNIACKIAPWGKYNGW